MPHTDPAPTLAAILEQHHACPEGRRWAAAFESPSAAWRACRRADWMLWALQGIGYKHDTKLRLFACWCVRHTPIGGGRVVWDLLTDGRGRAAVIAAERFAAGEGTADELAAAAAAAWAAAAAEAEAEAAAAEAQAEALRVLVGDPFAAMFGA